MNRLYIRKSQRTHYMRVISEVYRTIHIAVFNRAITELVTNENMVNSGAVTAIFLHISVTNLIETYMVAAHNIVNVDKGFK